MTCIDEGVLRAHLDSELPDDELAKVNEHLATCSECHARLEKLRVEANATQGLMAMLAPAADSVVNPAEGYKQFRGQLVPAEEPASWITRLFAPSWRPAWGLAAVAAVVAILLSVNPVRAWAQRVLAMLRVQKIQAVSVDPSTLMSSSEPDSRAYKLVNQFVADSVVMTMDPGKAQVFSGVSQASQFVGYPIRTIGSLAAPGSVEVHGDTAFQMTLNRDRVQSLLEGIGRSDIQIPQAADGALIVVHIPRNVVSIYGDCPVRQANGNAHAESEIDRKMARMADARYANCVYLIQSPSPTVSVPPNLNMAEIAEAALQLVGMSPAEAHSFCQTVDWSSTLVVPVPRNTSSYETVPVDGVEGTLITDTASDGTRYSLLWVKNGMIHSLTGRGNSSEALSLAASLR